MLVVFKWKKLKNFRVYKTFERHNKRSDVCQTQKFYTCLVLWLNCSILHDTLVIKDTFDLEWQDGCFSKLIESKCLLKNVCECCVNQCVNAFPSVWSSSATLFHCCGRCVCARVGVSQVRPDTIFNCYLLWFHDKTDTSSYDSTDVC